MTTNYKINDKATIAGKPYRVYNVIENAKLVCFGRISKTTGKDLSAMNKENLLTLTFADVEKFEKLGTIVK